MKLTRRNYRHEDDYWRMRASCAEVMHANGRRETNWHVARLDYWRWHVNENLEGMRLEEVIFLWEDARGNLAAVLNPEGRADVHLQIDLRCAPHVRRGNDPHCRRLPGRLGGWKAQAGGVGRRSRQLRQAILARRGFHKGSWQGIPAPVARWKSTCRDPPGAGYGVRALGETNELPDRSWASWRAFHPEEPDERYEGWTWYSNIQRMPLYRRDLDLVGVAPDGKIASFCTLWYDDVTRTAYFEPVGTMPEHQRRGLGKAMLVEGLRRLQRLGGDLAFVGSYSEAAGALYASAGFIDYDLSEPWEKEWTIQPPNSR